MRYRLNFFQRVGISNCFSIIYCKKLNCLHNSVGTKNNCLCLSVLLDSSFIDLFFYLNYSTTLSSLMYNEFWNQTLLILPFPYISSCFSCLGSFHFLINFKISFKKFPQEPVGFFEGIKFVTANILIYFLGLFFFFISLSSVL